MSVKKPTSISLKWWKKYVPNSLPKSKVIEENLKYIEKLPSGLAHEAVRKVFEAEGNLREKQKEAQEIVRKVNALLDELKRFQLIVTKDKQTHKDFLAGIDDLIRLVKNDQAALKAVLVDAMSNATAGAKSEKMVIKNIDISEAEVIGLGKLITGYKRDLSNTADPKQISQMISHTRYAEPAIKDHLRTSKEMVSGLRAASQDARDALDGLTLQAKSVVKDCRDFQKLLVQKCIEQFGEAKGKKLYLKSEAVKPAL